MSPRKIELWGAERVRSEEILDGDVGRAGELGPDGSGAVSAGEREGGGDGCDNSSRASEQIR